MPHLRIAVLPLILATTCATAQQTVPHFSTFFGGADRDVPWAIHRGPGDVITVVGHTRSLGLASPGAFQQTIPPSPVTLPNGNVDAFVARFVPNTTAPGHVCQWFTYLGGSGIELAFDLAVDAAGVTTVVGLSGSVDFPDPTGTTPPPLQGNTDGFVAQIDATGSTLLSSIFVGGSGDDRVCEVELETASGLAMIAGNTESTNPPGSMYLPGAVNGFKGGSIDAFVARLVLGNPITVLWSNYLGGNNTEGLAYANWPGFAQMWEGNLDRMALTLDGNGDPVLATVSFFASIPAYTTPNRIMGPVGQGDIYLARLDRNMPAPFLPTYATFFGGSSDDRPKAIVRHPRGGFVVSGVTASANLPTTPTPGCYQGAPSPGTSVAEAYLAWLDPALGSQGNRYTTYFGGSAGEDNFHAMAIETSGVVTVAGFSIDGSAPTTPRCLGSTPGPNQSFGLIARFELAGNGTRDLHYSGLITQPAGDGRGMLVTGLALDERGDAWFCGRCSLPQPFYPLVNPIQLHAGGSDLVVTHMPLLPGGVTRDMLPSGTPACTSPPLPLYTGMANAPVANDWFGITATNAPPVSIGVLVVGAPLPAPVPVFNCWLLASLDLLFVGISDLQGHARLDFTLPPGPPAPANWGLAAQWFFITNAACPGSGPFGNSERLLF